MSETINDIRDRSRERDRSRRGDKPSRFSDGGRDRSRDRGGGGGLDRKRNSNRRVYVSNICYEYRWQDLKDLFRTNVGDVAHVELFVDENDKPRGCGVVEFVDEKSVKKCLSVMHRYDLKGRKLVVREDFGNERDKFGNIINGRGRDLRERDRDNLPDLRDEIRLDRSLPSLMGNSSVGDKWGNTYGLSPQFLEELDIRGPLLHRIFVANLDYKVDEKKLQEVFRLAGKVLTVELSRDKDGNSRGFAVIEYDHPVESVQAISMLNGQQLYDRKLMVRMDRDRNDGPPKLPEGLKGVGLGLGPNGDPLRDVSRNLPSSTGGSSGGSNVDSGINTGGGILGAIPTQTLSHTLGSGLNSSTLSNVVGGGSGLASLANTQAAALQASLGLSNPLLASGLSELAMANLNNTNLNAASLVSNSLAQNSSLAASLAHNLTNSSGLGSNSLMGSSNTGLGSNSSNYSRLDSTGFHSSGVGMTGSNTNTGGGGSRFPNTSSYIDRNNDFDSASNNMMSRNRSYGNQDGSKADGDYRNSSSLYSSLNVSGQNRSRGGGAMGGSGSGSSNVDRDTDTIIVSNLPQAATWTTLRERFSQFGEIAFCEMRGNDVGVIKFNNKYSAKEAVLMMDRVRVEGRTIDVRLF